MYDGDGKDRRTLLEKIRAPSEALGFCFPSENAFLKKSAPLFLFVKQITAWHSDNDVDYGSTDYK